MPRELDLEPTSPLLVADRFRPLGKRLVELLGGLRAEDWRRPTICPAWAVRDVAAHLLDTACRRLAAGRDGHLPPPPNGAFGDRRELIDFLDELNRSWVEVSQRLSPALLVTLLQCVEVELADHLESVDPRSAALFAVEWAGEEDSAMWFDVARELTERWLHQQQIRLAVGAAPLDDPFFVEPVLETFLLALPHRYRQIEAPAGTTIALQIVAVGGDILAWTLRREKAGWRLWRGLSGAPIAALEIELETAWLLLTKSLEPAVARQRALRVDGEARWLDPFFQTIAVMARRADEDHGRRATSHG